MAKVKCEYCGSWISPTDERCPVCYATNKNHQRLAPDTPQTIEDLQGWYKARNLPPEETTRFFIGKNFKGPKAFGIYEENGQFIVYKNKANGERAIRYKGTDEAYAVNEIYLKLKEEILRQKNINIQKREVSYNQSDDRYRKQLNSYRRSKRNKHLASSLITFTILILIVQLLPLMLIGHLFDSSNDYYSTAFNYYLTDNNEFFYSGTENYLEDSFDWWKFNKETNEWEFFGEIDGGTLPDGVNLDKEYDDAIEFSKEVGIDYELINIYNSRNYIDMNHDAPSQSYYEYNNNLYYYLDDSYGEEYGSGDNSGWYIFKDNDWEYYCSNDDKETMGEDLWYNPSDYWVGSEKADVYEFAENENWNFTDFSTTDWYVAAERAEQARNDYYESIKDNNSSYDNDYDYDYDYDWSDDYDWDYDAGDWDSDW